MNEVQLLYNTLILGGLLFAIGFLGFLTRRNLIVMFLCAEMMLQGVSVSLVAWGRYHHDWGGQMLVVFIITVAACEAAIAMALVMMLVQRSGKLDSLWWQELREATQPAYVDQAVPEGRIDEEVWPKLIPAGIEPARDIDDELHRPRV
jgi:NADH-quinone oxidoreductase subunit K